MLEQVREETLLSAEGIEEIYQREYKKACKFSEKYETSLSPKNFDPNRPADRQRTFNTTHREFVAMAIAKAQLENALNHKLGSHTLGEIIQMIDDKKLVKLSENQGTPLVDTELEVHCQDT